MKKRILSILLTLCMVLTMMPATVFAADGEVAARASETGGLYEHHEACGANSAGASDTMMPKTRSGAVRPAATQYTYTLHYDANGGSGAPPSQSVISSEFHVWVPISDKIPTRDGYTFMGWANSRTGKPIYGGNGGYTECLVVHGYDMSTTIYAIWEVHNHSWGRMDLQRQRNAHTHLYRGQQPYRNRQLLRRQGYVHGEGCLRNLP